MTSPQYLQPLSLALQSLPPVQHSFSCTQREREGKKIIKIVATVVRYRDRKDSASSRCSLLERERESKWRLTHLNCSSLALRDLLPVAALLPETLEPFLTSMSLLAGAERGATAALLISAAKAGGRGACGEL